MAILAYGGLAEYAVAPAAETFVMPARHELRRGRRLSRSPTSRATWRSAGRAGSKPGETLLVLGAAGGVGLTAVEIGKAMGARVIAAASTAEKLAVAHGARRRRHRRTTPAEKLTERVMALTGGKGADVCFDPVGGELFDAALSSLGWGGRILLVGFVGGVPQIPANRLLVKHRAALGSSLRYFRWHAPDKLARSVEELLRWYGEGKLRPCVTHRLPLERSVEAHPAADRPQGARQGRGRAGARDDADPRRAGTARHVALVTIDNQPTPQRHDTADAGGAGPPVGRARARRLPLHRR